MRHLNAHRSTSAWIFMNVHIEKKKLTSSAIKLPLDTEACRRPMKGRKQRLTNKVHHLKWKLYVRS